MTQEDFLKSNKSRGSFHFNETSWEGEGRKVRKKYLNNIKLIFSIFSS